MKILKKTLAFSALCMSCFMAHPLLAQDALYSNTFPLGDVKILDGPFLKAQQLNLHVMEEYDTDRLLAPFLIEAGLEPKGELFENWKGLDGHVLGHYLSALSISYAATRSEMCRDAVQKKIFTGYDGGMLVHTGYLFGTIAPMGCYKVSGAPIGIGGTARIHLKKHWRVGFEGYFSSMGVMKNGSYIKYGWGGVLADAYWNIGRFMPYAGITIGGGANSDLFIMDKSSKDLHNNWEPTQQSVIHKQGFMVIDPYVGCDYVVSKAFHLTLKLDWMNCISRENSTIPTGPRVYFGFLFYH